jgi:flagellar motor switch protein FliM
LPLDDVLDLEVGDVIALGVALDGLVVVQVEGERFATAHFGEHEGRLAVRIQSPSTPEKS